jgi:hypothetical protein
MFDERQIAILQNMSVPSTYWNLKSQQYQYWFRSLLQKIDSCLEFKGLPKEWSQDFFLLCLWARGYVAVFESARFGDKETGIAFQPCTLSGYDFYYQPTKAIVSNPLYQKELEIHKDCEILKLTPDFNGVWDIIDHFATELAEATKGINIGLINAKVPMVVTADSLAESEKLKKVYDKIQAGESLVVWKEDTNHFDTEVMPRKNPFADAFMNNYTQTYVVTDLLSDMQTILDQFYMEIGLPVRNYDGKAHMLQAEADMSNAQAQSRVSCWVNTLTESFELINNHYGTNLEVKQYEFEDNSMDNGEDAQFNGRAEKPN